MEAWRESPGYAIGRLVALAVVTICMTGGLTVSALAKSPAKPRFKPSLIKGAFVPLKGKMTSPRYDAMTVTLPDGRVLITGGTKDYSGKGAPAWNVSSVDVFDPGTGAFEEMAPLAGPRGRGQTALLADGRVLLVGGNFCCMEPPPMIEIYDPVSGTSQPLAPEEDIPYASTIAPLPDGRVLIIGGWGAEANYAAILDPPTGLITELDDMPVARRDGQIALQPDGRILIFGGLVGDREPQVQSVFFDPTDASFDLGPRQNVARAAPATAVLGSGKVLVAGGAEPESITWNGNGTRILKSAEIFNPATGRFEMVGSPIIGRFDGLATQMSDGRVLVTGGSAWVRRGSRLKFKPTLASEIFDPGSRKFIRTGDLGESRQSSSIVPLPSGRVLLAGGFYNPEPHAWEGKYSAEIFDPYDANPRVRILKVKPRSLSVRVNQKFRIKLRVRNDGKGTARWFRVCATTSRWMVGEPSCPTVRNLKPRRSRWVVFEDAFSAVLAGTTRRLEILVLGQGVNRYETVRVKIKAAARQ